MVRIALQFFLFTSLIAGVVHLPAQRIDFENDRSINNSLFIKLYGEVDFNQKLSKDVRYNGKLDVHRIVTLIGYQFSSKTQFVTEIEYEHVSEVFIEQAFAKHQLAPNHHLKAGLILIPMGQINENHEPTAFYSVERPLIDKFIVPSTWREIGAGMTGIFSSLSLRYKAFLVGGFKSHNGERGLLSADQALRGARQKGIESTVSSVPNLSAQLEYFGAANHKVGLSIYSGRTASPLYNGLNKSDAIGLARADSSTIGLTMIGLHSQSAWDRMRLNTQFVMTSLRGVSAYNALAGQQIGNQMYGLYVEPAIAIIQDGNLDKLLFFARYSQYALASGQSEFQSPTERVFTVGVNYKPVAGLVFKMDYQFFNNTADRQYRQFNLNVGVWF